MKAQDSLLGIDLGTQGLKIILVEAASARVIASASAPVESISRAPGYMVQDPQAWWQSLRQLSRGLLRERDIAPEAIAAIGLSGHMHSIVPMHADGRVARNCLVWADTRSQSQADRIHARSAPRLWNPAIAPYSLAKLLWLREHEPAVYEQMATVLFSKDYLRYRMTGRIASDFSDASASLMWDFAKRDWDAGLLAQHDIPLDILPPVYGSADAAGTLSAEAADALGLTRRAIVAYGGGDAACAVVGAGIPDRDTLMINAGTAVQVIEIQAQPTPFHPQSAIRYLFELGIEGTSVAIGALNSAGHSLNWWRNLLDPSLAPADLDKLAAAEPSRADGSLFLPYLQGTGTPFLRDGPYGGFVQLSATADKGALTRAVMDGVAFGIRLCAEALVGEEALRSKRVLITGGLPKSPLMREILSQVLPARTIFRQFSDMSALGAAAHAAVAAGISADASAFLADFDYGEISHPPDPAMQARYDETYAQFKRWAGRITAE